MHKTHDMKDGEMKYFRQRPCGKCDVNKFLQHVQDNEIKVRFQDTENSQLWMFRIK